MIAIILAGGESRRMRGINGERREKALITIDSSENQKRLMDLVVESVQESKVEDFFVAITKNTPKTEKYCKLMNYKILETPGRGYHEDLHHLLLSYPEFVSIACDVPFLRKEHINEIINAYLAHPHRVSTTGTVPLAIVPRGITPSYIIEYGGKKLVSCGINVVTGSEDSIPFIFDDPLLAINVNTEEDLSVALSVVK